MTPEQAMQCCNSMPCSSHGHDGQDCCKTMPSMHSPFVPSSSVRGVSFSPVLFAVMPPAGQSPDSALAEISTSADFHAPPIPHLNRPQASSHLVNPPVASQLFVLVCLGTAIFAGGIIRGISQNHCAHVVAAHVIGLCHSSQRTRACTRDGSAAVSGRRTRVLQLDIHHAEPDAANIGWNSANSASNLLARRRFQFHVGVLPRF